MFNLTNSTKPLLLISGLVIVSMPLAQGPKKSRGPRPPLARQVPFPFVSKEAGFEVPKPLAGPFNEMGCLVAEIPPSFLPGLKSTQKFVQLRYGYKKGGVLSVYITKKFAGGDAAKVSMATLDGRVFRDRPDLPTFKLTPIKHSSLLIAVATTDPVTLTEFLKVYKP